MNMGMLPWLLAGLVVALSGVWSHPAAAQEGQWQPEQPGVPDAPSAPYTAAPPIDYSLEEEDAEEQRRALEQFEPELSPYGSWRDDTKYGRVWVPRRSLVGGGFVPYQTGGHWTLTAHDDWLWVSDYPFGWVAFHYGRWALLSPGVWGWLPGYRYSPAWVDFRVGVRGYVGWGPRPPRRYWRNNAYWALGTPVFSPFVFCPSSYVFAALVTPHILRDRARIRRYSRQSRDYRLRRSVRGRRVYGPSLRVAGVARAAAPRRRVSLSSQRRRVVRRSSAVRKPARYKNRRKAAPRRRSATGRRAAGRRTRVSDRRASTSRSRRAGSARKRPQAGARRGTARRAGASRAKPRRKPATRGRAGNRADKRKTTTKERAKRAESPAKKAKPSRRARPKTRAGRTKSRARKGRARGAKRSRKRSSGSNSRRSRH